MQQFRTLREECTKLLHPPPSPLRHYREVAPDDPTCKKQTTLPPSEKEDKRISVGVSIEVELGKGNSHHRLCQSWLPSAGETDEVRVAELVFCQCRKFCTPVMITITGLSSWFTLFLKLAPIVNRS